MAAKAHLATGVMTSACTCASPSPQHPSPVTTQHCLTASSLRSSPRRLSSSSLQSSLHRLNNTPLQTSPQYSRLPLLLTIGWQIDSLKRSLFASHPFRTLITMVHGTIPHGMASPVDSLSPLSSINDGRRMVHVKTKEECRLGNDTVDVWCIELPSKHAEGILKIIKEKIPGQDAIDLQHLRRFARPRFIPAHVTGNRDPAKEMHAVSRTWSNSPAMIQLPGTTIWEWSGPRRDYKGHARITTLWLLVCPTTIITESAVKELLLQHTPFSSTPDSWAYPLDVKKVTVPLLAPTNPEMANEWSEKYWPTFYRKTNPFGAHPATIQKAEQELNRPPAGSITIGEAMRLAEDAAAQTVDKNYGVQSGCAVIERVGDMTEIIAVAGDARHKPLAKQTFATRCVQGNPACHAVMRAIGMVARKRLRCASQSTARSANKALHALETAHIDQSVRDAFFLDAPLTPLEQQYFEKDNLVPDGYLCLKLEIFLTHEPCVMCSMALVHSRVGKVIFRDRMPKTGGLTAETPRNVTGPVGLGYGLCWRKELNWQFMCWEYTNTADSLPDVSSLSLYANFMDAVKSLPQGFGVIPNKVDKTKDGGAPTVEKYSAPIVHHRHRKQKKHKFSTTTNDEPSSTEPNTAEDYLPVITNPFVSSFASIHV